MILSGTAVKVGKFPLSEHQHEKLLISSLYSKINNDRKVSNINNNNRNYFESKVVGLDQIIKKKLFRLIFYEM